MVLALDVNCREYIICLNDYLIIQCGQVLFVASPFNEQDLIFDAETTRNDFMKLEYCPKINQRISITVPREITAPEFTNFKNSLRL